jgi:hypothetical protein
MASRVVKGWSWPRVARAVWGHQALRGRAKAEQAATEGQRRMWLEWASGVRASIHGAGTRTLQNLKIRRDGSPSAHQPAATLPVALWATVQATPDGDEDGSVRSRLTMYRYHLIQLKARGLYDGPTELTYPERGPSDGEA